MTAQFTVCHPLKTPIMLIAWPFQARIKEGCDSQVKGGHKN